MRTPVERRALPYNATMTDSSDVIILGGGVIGLACAHYLLQAGRQVRVLEQGTVSCGSSHGNCGTLTPSHATPLAAPGMTIGRANGRTPTTNANLVFSLLLQKK